MTDKSAASSFINVRKRRSTYDPNKMESRHIARMYQEDWYNNLLPKRNSTFKVMTSSEHSKDMLASIIGQKSQRNDNLERIVQSFLEQVIRLLQSYPLAAFEICQADNNSFFLKPINAETLCIEEGVVTQFVDAKIYEIEKNYLFCGEICNLFLIESPSWLEAGNGFVPIIDGLNKESNRSLKSTDLISKHVNQKILSFDYNVFNMEANRGILSLTKNSGWDIRQLANKQITEFYWVHRILTFKTNQIRLCEHIIERFNNCLIPKLNKKGLHLEELKLTGVHTYSDLMQRKSDLIDGKISFREALDLEEIKIP